MMFQVLCERGHPLSLDAALRAPACRRRWTWSLCAAGRPCTSAASKLPVLQAGVRGGGGPTVPPMRSGPRLSPPHANAAAASRGPARRGGRTSLSPHGLAHGPSRPRASVRHELDDHPMRREDVLAWTKTAASRPEKARLHLGMEPGSSDPGNQATLL